MRTQCRCTWHRERQVAGGNNANTGGSADNNIAIGNNADASGSAARSIASGLSANASGSSVALNTTTG